MNGRVIFIPMKMNNPQDLNGMTDEELAKEIAHKVMGLVPCDQWTYMNFGSAGGAALRKNCHHENCYPTQELGSILGKIGGIPDYLGNWNMTMKVREKIGDMDIEFVFDGCRVYTWPEGKQVVCVFDTKPQRAICLAALASVSSALEGNSLAASSDHPFSAVQ